MPALCVRGGTWKWDGGHVVGLELVPMRLVIEKSRLQLNKDLGVKRGHANSMRHWLHIKILQQHAFIPHRSRSSYSFIRKKLHVSEGPGWLVCGFLPLPETRSPPPSPWLGPTVWSPAYAPETPAGAPASTWRSGSTWALRISLPFLFSSCFCRWRNNDSNYFYLQPH